MKTRTIARLARLARWLCEFGSTLQAITDPHSQFHAVPVAWLVAQRPHDPPPGHPEGTR